MFPPKENQERFFFVYIQEFASKNILKINGHYFVMRHDLEISEARFEPPFVLIIAQQVDLSHVRANGIL